VREARLMVDAPAANRTNPTSKPRVTVARFPHRDYANASRLAPTRHSSIIAAFDKVILVIGPKANIVPVAKCITVIMSCPQINNEQNQLYRSTASLMPMPILHVHGLVFVTSIYHWQDQPGINTTNARVKN